MDKKKLAKIAYLVLFKKKNKKRFWHQAWLGDYERLNHSFSFTLEPILFSGPVNDSQKYVRLPNEIFESILQQIHPLVCKKTTNARMTITPREKLSITLSFLAYGLSLQRLAYEFRVGVSTAFAAINEVITALNIVLVPQYLRIPNKTEEWRAIADDFQNTWNFPNCIGALDGKHIQLFPPRNSGSLYYNYKEGFSIVLLALVDANYKFIAVDVGANGKCSDSGIWNQSSLRKMVLENTLNIPCNEKLPNSNVESPYVILGDSGFPLEEKLMRPFPEQNITPKERVFNYRLSRARRVSENAFGILSNRWRILLNRMLLSPEKATAIVTACCALHNLLCSHKEAQNVYIKEMVDCENLITGELSPGLWRTSPLDKLPQRKTSNFSYNAKIVREKLKHYLNEEGKVAWQDKSACISISTKP